MKNTRKLYRNEKWENFSNTIKCRDNYACSKCGRKESDVVLQVHHTQYKIGLKPWEYAYSDCITLCKGCHASEHNITDP
ncbi:MAG: HNH endonuclease [Candidatus Pacearchaeota archaeon]